MSNNPSTVSRGDLFETEVENVYRSLGYYCTRAEIKGLLDNKGFLILQREKSDSLREDHLVSPERKKNATKEEYEEERRKYYFTLFDNEIIKYAKILAVPQLLAARNELLTVLSEYIIEKLSPILTTDETGLVKEFFGDAPV